MATCKICVVDSGNGEFRNQLNYVLSSFAPDVSGLYVIKRSEYDTPRGTPLSDAIYIANAEELPAGALVVFAADNGRFIQGATNIKDFRFPADAIYMVGADNGNLNVEDHFGSRTIDHKVFIPTDSTDEM